MARANTSGYALSQADISIVLGMAKRGDRNHDIAAWFGVNQGRVAEAKDGKFGTPPAAPASVLPPKGPPGIKGRRLRGSVGEALHILNEQGEAGLTEAKEILANALDHYDADEA